MAFLAPLFLAGAAAAAIPLVLHLLKRQPEPRVKFAAVKLLRRAPVELTEKRRLRELLLLALRMAALALLAIAFARPFLASGAASGSTGATIVAIDRSASLSAPGQMDRAKRLARERLASAPPGDLVGVVAFDDRADVLVRPTADRALASAAIDGVQPGFGATRYRGALAAAAQALDRRAGTIVVVTDLQESGWDVGDTAAVPESARVEIADVGAVAENLSVAAVRLDGDRLIASIRNSGARPRDSRVRLVLDGRRAGEVGVTVPPNGSADVALGGAGRAAAAAVSVDDAGGIQADNVRYAVLDRADRPAVLVVTASGDLARDAFYLEQALTAGAGDGLSLQVAGASAASLSAWSAARLSSQAAVVLLSTEGLELRGREAIASYVAAGGGLLIAAGPGIDGAVVSDVLGADAPLQVVVPTDDRAEDRALAPADLRHPVFRAFEGGAATLGLVTFERVARVGGPSCRPIARFTSGEAALIDCAAGEGRALVLASDLNDRWNDFPLHATFVPFVREMIAYLSGARPRVGDYLVGDVPAGVPATPGIATLPAAGGASPRRVAVNVDPRESETGRLSAEDFQAAVTRLKDVGVSEARVEARQQEDRQHLWEYVLALTIAVLVIEGLVASRTA